MPDNNNTGGDWSYRTLNRRSVLALTGGTLATTTLSGLASADSGPTLVSFDTPPGASSPSSKVAPDDGFASTEWATEKTLEVTRVTNLDKDGPGSLKDAMSRELSDDADGRVVVFEVGGIIDLEGEQLDPESDNMIVAGQTAPGPGITLIRGSIEVDGKNNFFQHIRVRSGSDVLASAGGEGSAADSIGIQDESENIILDHCTATWGTDENMSIGDTCTGVTFSNSLIAEGLAARGIHPDGGEHSNGTLVGHDSEDVAILGNLYANSNDRHPRLKGGTQSVVANNVMYNFDTAIRLGDDAAINDTTRSSVVGNVFRPGENTPLEPPIVGANEEEDVKSIEVFIDDNVVQGSIPMRAADPWKRLEFVDEAAVWPANLDLDTNSAAFGHVANAAGARPARRTPHDARVVRDVRTKKGGVPGTEEDVGGYPNHSKVVRKLDVPKENFGQWLSDFTAAVERGGRRP